MIRKLKLTILAETEKEIDQEVKKSTEVRKALYERGIEGFLILTRNGLPVLERFYNENESYKLGDSVLTAGFLSALTRFIDDHVAGLLSDIGVHVYRLFFDYNEEMLFIIVYDEYKLSNLPLSEFLTLFKGTLSEIKSTFRELTGEFELKTLVENPFRLDKFSEFLNEIGPKFDRIIFKSHNMLMNIISETERENDVS